MDSRLMLDTAPPRAPLMRDLLPPVAAEPALPSLAHLQGLWLGLPDQIGPTQQLAWIDAAAHAFASRQRLHIVTTARQGRITAAAPLVRATAGGLLRHARLLSVAEMHEPMDLVYRDEQALEELVSALLREGRPLLLERLPADSPTVAAFERLSRRRALLVKRPHPGAPFIPLDASWAEPEQHLSSRRRSDLRRARRRAEQLGTMRAEVLSPGSGDVDTLLDLACQIEARSWKGKEGTALTCDRPRAAFFRRYTHAACREGVLRMCFLRLNEEAVAMQIAVQTARRFWLLKIGYDERFAACSPGQLLMRETIRHTAEAGLESYELLGSPAPWTQMWTRQEHPCVSLYVYPFAVRALAALACAVAVALAHRSL